MKIKLFILIGFITLVLLGLCVFWSINIYTQRYALWLNEYNAQIQQFGFYKDDINLINQYKKYALNTFQLIVNVFSYIIIVCLSVFAYIRVDEEYDWGVIL